LQRKVIKACSNLCGLFLLVLCGIYHIEKVKEDTMETKVTVVYECKKCGTEVTVNTDGLKSVDPIYCCGNPLFKRKKAAAKTTRKKK